MKEFEQVERELLEALRRSDRSALETLLADDFLITTAGWIREPAGKRAWIEAASSEHVLESFDLQISHVRRYDDVAVVLSESTQSGTHRGEPWQMSFHYTDVWRREGARWRLAVRHA
ncbi:MAG TPA: nuclear transport factor 2 family protein, partial [Gaiellaceae bacterium]|nr:nuclear transport factor 2 family protein [Gaiellaceae bacterium]